MAIATRENFGIRDGYNARAEPAYFLDNLDDGAMWQPDVYRYAFELARASKSHAICDVGCGNGEKLEASPYPTIGIDFKWNIQFAQREYPHSVWIEKDLENGIGVGIVDNRTVMICSDVVEHLKMPLNLLSSLAHWTNHLQFVVISTPDRRRLYGYDHNGEPENPHHAREWMLPELYRYLRELGANIRLTGYTRCNDVTNAMSTMLIAGGIADIDFEAIAKQVGIEVVTC